MGHRDYKAISDEPEVVLGAGLYDAVVGLLDGDYETVGAAFADGATRVYVRNGAYVETGDLTLVEGGAIVGESKGGVVIDFNGGSSKIKIDPTGGVVESTGTVSITQGTTTITGVGTTFTNLNPGDFIRLDRVYHKISTITDNLNMVLVETFRGETISAGTYRAHAMVVGVEVKNLMVKDSLSYGVHLKGALWSTLRDVAVSGCTIDGVRVEDSSNVCLENVSSHGNTAFGLLIATSTFVRVCGGPLFNNLGGGANSSTATDTIYDSVLVAQNGASGLVLGTCDKVEGGVVRNNANDGIQSGESSRIVNVEITGNGDDGIKAGDRNVIVGNRIADNTTDGIALLGDLECEIAGNLIDGNANDGISIASGSNRTVITGNTIINSGANGIDTGANDATITGNVIESNASKGIQILLTGDRNVVVSNVLRSNGDEGVRIDTGASDNIVGLNKSSGNGLADSFAATTVLETTRLAALTDNRLLKGDVAAGGIQESGITISDNDEVRHAGTVEWDKGADIASQATLDLGFDGNYFDVTGTTGVTAASAKPIGTRILLQFDAVLTVTHHATNLRLRDGLNFAVAAGDHLELISYGSGTWREIGRSSADSWPFNVITVDLNNPNADFATVDAAVSAAASGDVIQCGVGTFTVETLTLATKNNLRFVGQGKDKTIFQGALSSAGQMIDLNGKVATFEKIGFDLNWTGSTGTADIFQSGSIIGLTLIDCDLDINGTGATGGDINGTGSNLDPVLKNCSIAATLGGASTAHGISVAVSRTATLTNCTSSINGAAGSTGTLDMVGASTLRLRSSQIANLIGSGAGQTVEVIGLSQIDARSASVIPVVRIGDGQSLEGLKTASFDAEFDNGNSGATPTINWNNGQKQKITLDSGTVTFALTAPPGPTSGLVLKMINMNGRTLAWPGGALVKWPGGTIPTASAGATDVDLYSFYYDGTNYWGGVLKAMA